MTLVPRSGTPALGGEVRKARTLVLEGRRSGYTIILVGSLFGSAMPVIHMMGEGVGGNTAKSGGGFFFIWTLIALGVTALFDHRKASHNEDEMTEAAHRSLWSRLCFGREPVGRYFDALH